MLIIMMGGRCRKMLHIILLIFKIIGIILLVLLGILLLVVLTILLVPVRYRVAIEHGDTFRMEGRVSWLLHFIHARFSYLEGKPQIRIRIFGFVIYDNLKPKATKTKSKKHKNAVKKGEKHKSVRKAAMIRKKEKEFINEHKSDTIRSVQIQKHADKNESVLKKQSDRKDIFEKNNSEHEIISIDHSLDEDKIHENLVKENLVKENLVKENLVKENLVKDDIAKEDIAKEDIAKENSVKDERSFNNIEKEAEEPILLEVEDQNTRQQNASKEKTFFLKKILIKIKNLLEKVRTFFRELKNKIIKSFEAVVNLRDKTSLITNFIKNERNREGFHSTYSSLKKLLKHILPTKLKSKLIFGTGDPCTTGQALGFMGFLYSFYGDKIQIIPDFENSRLEGKHDARGRIRVITVLIIVIKLIFDKRFKQLRKNFIILKEAL
jgi:hypothetical protein